ncbi:Uncharacterised protein [Mycobacteroides abscessus subsp. abscessus]|uniref:DUF6556 family protein n=1 Tax=Streptococcus sp. HMSC062D07 TaxID=1739461 RepID=UPI0008A5998C|nr:DUF6556 family protein [Streptococcus sp. HMSC062D07]OFQ05064.1 hypothetical protein HMPREF2957_03360 [Streptococcus sp. HMSC062D07]SHZ80419.1 Uncharacterised protein [Mycobacteroides abscessus subsp. abscessus]
MSNYRRKSKPKTEHIKKGFTVFQKTIATLASILGLITASITIMNALDKNKDHKDTTTQTTIIKEVQKEAPAESNAPEQNQGSNQETNSANSGVDDKNNNVQSEETTQASNNIPKNQTDGVAQSDTVATDNKTNP